MSNNRGSFTFRGKEFCCAFGIQVPSSELQRSSVSKQRTVDSRCTRINLHDVIFKRRHPVIDCDMSTPRTVGYRNGSSASDLWVKWSTKSIALSWIGRSRRSWSGCKRSHCPKTIPATSKVCHKKALKQQLHARDSPQASSLAYPSTMPLEVWTVSRSEFIVHVALGIIV